MEQFVLPSTLVEHCFQKVSLFEFKSSLSPAFGISQFYFSKFHLIGYLQVFLPYPEQCYAYVLFEFWRLYVSAASILAYISNSSDLILCVESIAVNTVSWQQAANKNSQGPPTDSMSKRLHETLQFLKRAKKAIVPATSTTQTISQTLEHLGIDYKPQPPQLLQHSCYNQKSKSQTIKHLNTR